MSKRWIRADLSYIQAELKDKAHITSSVEEGYRIIKSWSINYKCSNLDKSMESNLMRLNG